MMHIKALMTLKTLGNIHSMTKIMRNSMPQPRISMNVPSEKMAAKAAPMDRISSKKASKTTLKAMESTSYIKCQKMSEMVAVTVSSAAASAWTPSRRGARPIWARIVSAPASERRRAVSVLITKVALPSMLLAPRVVPMALA